MLTKEVLILTAVIASPEHVAIEGTVQPAIGRNHPQPADLVRQHLSQNKGPT
jgi:hypothetical protein